MKKYIITVFFILLPILSSAEPIRVVLLNPGGNHWFWEMVVGYMQAAAEDLDMELEVVTSDWNHLLTIEQSKKVVNRKNPPDYIITGNEKGNAGEIIKICDKAGVNVFLFSNGFANSEDITAFGDPREKYKHWIGEIIPNNFSAGYQMGKVLIDEALSDNLTGKDGKVNIAAISGAFATHASVERVKGLKKVINEYEDKVNLLQIVQGDWTFERGKEVGKGLFHRFEDVKIIWGANDTTALGAMEAAAAVGKKPGDDVLFGGCGWYAPALHKIKTGKLTTSLGGHFMEGGWAMVLIHDYHHGKDFFPDTIKTYMYSIDKTNIDKYLTVFGNQNWNKIDFKKFSKVYNPTLKSYDFSLHAVFKQFQISKSD